MARPSDGGAFARLKADLDRYFVNGGKRLPLADCAKLAFDMEGPAALTVFRLGQYLRDEAPALVRMLTKVPYALLLRGMHLGLGIHLYPDARIGGGLYIGHSGGIWISPHAIIGEHCNINHEVTIGVAGPAARGPVLGDRVWVGPNATITGPVKVGSGAVIGANSLVASDVPEDGVVLGVPAKLISRSGSARLLEPRAELVPLEAVETAEAG